MAKYCIYCGKQLADGEVCNCSHSQQAQNAWQSQNQQNSQSNQQQAETSQQSQMNQQTPPGRQGQQGPQQGQYQNQQGPNQAQWQNQQGAYYGQWHNQQQVPPQGPQGQWHGQQPPYYWQRIPNPNSFGSRLTQLIKEFFNAPVNAVVNQVKKRSLPVAFFILGITLGIRLLNGLIYGLVNMPGYFPDIFGDFYPYPKRTGFLFKSIFGSLFGEVFYLAVLIFGLYLFSMAFTGRKLNAENACIAVGCSALLLPVLYILSMVPVINVLFFNLGRFFTTILAIFAYQAAEGIEDKNRMVYIALCTTVVHLITQLLLSQIFGGTTFLL